MKVNLYLEKTIIGKKNYYIVVNEVFYIKINKKIFNELADYLKIDLEKKDNEE